MSKFEKLIGKILNEEEYEPQMHAPTVKAKSYGADVYLRRSFTGSKQEVFDEIKSTLMSAEEAETVSAPYAQSTIPPKWNAASEVVPYKDSLENDSSMLELTVSFPAPNELHGDVHDMQIVKEVIQNLGYKRVFVFPINP